MKPTSLIPNALQETPEQPLIVYLEFFFISTVAKKRIRLKQMLPVYLGMGAHFSTAVHSRKRLTLFPVSEDHTLQVGERRQCFGHLYYT